jgi:hypothetical protein
MNIQYIYRERELLLHDDGGWHAAGRTMQALALMQVNGGRDEYTYVSRGEWDKRELCVSSIACSVYMAGWRWGILQHSIFDPSNQIKKIPIEMKSTTVAHAPTYSPLLHLSLFYLLCLLDPLYCKRKLETATSACRYIFLSLPHLSISNLKGWQNIRRQAWS